MNQMTKEKFTKAARGNPEWRWIDAQSIVVVPCHRGTRTDTGALQYLTEGPYRVQGKDYTVASLEKTGTTYRPVEFALSTQHYREAEQWEIRKFMREEVVV